MVVLSFRYLIEIAEDFLQILLRADDELELVRNLAHPASYEIDPLAALVVGAMPTRMLLSVGC